MTALRATLEGRKNRSSSEADRSKPPPAERIIGADRHARGNHGGRLYERETVDVRDKADGLLADEAPIHELEELQGLIAEGQERGFLTIEEISNILEEVEVTKEQVAELHGHLVDQGIDVVDANGT